MNRAMIEQAIRHAASTGALRCDAAESAHFARELEHVYGRTFDVEYPELKSRILVPASPDPAGEADKVFTYRMFDYVASTQPGADYADDPPRSDAFGKEYQHAIRPVTGSYGYSIDELMASAKYGRPLDASRARGTRLAIEQEIDRVIALGDDRFSDPDIKGFCNHDGVDAALVADDGTGPSREWKDKTPDLIKRDILEPIKKLRTDSKGVENGPWTIVLPTSAYTEIVTRRLTDALGETVASWLLREVPWIAGFEEWGRLDSVGSGSTGRMLIYERNADKVHYQVPMEFTQLPPEARVFEVTVACHARTGGIALPRPKSMAYRDGIC